MESHLQQDEECDLSFVEEHLGLKGWDAFREAIRKRQGPKGAAEFFPWILDGASAGVSKQLLDTLPAPARILYWAVWRPGMAPHAALDRRDQLTECSAPHPTYERSP